MNEEVLLVFSLGLCFLMAVLADAIGLSTELGAFLAGSLLAGTVHVEKIEHLVTPCKNLFGAVFFVSVGFMVQPSMILEYIVPIIIISVVSIVGKLVLLTLGGLAAGQDLDVSLHSAASQTQVGEFSFIIAGLGQSLNVTGAFLYPIIVAVSVVTTFTTPFLLKAAEPMTRLLEKVLPTRWLVALDNYCENRQAQKPGEDRDQVLYLKSYFSTMAFYGILAAGTILLGVQVLLPALTEVLAESPISPKVVSCVVIYLVLAFLLPAMLRIKKRYFTNLWLKSVYNRLLLSILLIFRVSLVVFLAMLPVFLIFHVSSLWMVLLVIPVAFLAFNSNRLAGQYLEFEARFLANLNERRLAEHFGQEGEGEVHHWLTEQLWVLPLDIPPLYPGGGLTLREHGWGKDHHVSIIKIIRGKEHMNIPNGDVSLLAGDKLVAMGSRKDLENFCAMQSADGVRPVKGALLRTLKDYIESQETGPKAHQLLCVGVELEKEMPQAGRPLRDSGIKEDWKAFLIGLERDLLPIPNPDKNLTLRQGDLLWVMGSQEMAAALMQRGLLD